MDKTTEKQLKSPEFRAALSAYAERLQRVFQEMGNLSGTGIALNRHAFHTPVRLQQCDPEAERRTHWRGSSESSDSGGPGGASRQSPPPIPESTFLHNWLKESPKPLLILAPFGSGKSVVLETFAVELAAKLRSWPLKTIPPYVPLPVRLRAWKWHRQDEPEDFLEFLYCSQEVIAPYDKDVLLTRDQIALLKSSKLLVPLFDGVDELPDAHTSGAACDPRADALRAIQGLFRGSHFAVASRPGYGAERRFETEQIHTLRELTSPEIETFIANRFKPQEVARKEAALEAYRTIQPAIDQFLRRPLFLAAWCEAPDSPLTTLGELMDQLLVKTFDPRRMQERGVTKDTIRDAKSGLAALLLPFAERGFGIRLSHSSLSDSPFQPSTKAKSSNLICWLEKAGLLEPVGDTNYQAFKVPIVEYLIGWYLAHRAMASEDGQREFVDIFRRWIWRPELHETLNYTFDELWHGGSSHCRFANALLDWAVAVAQHDSSREPLKEYAQRDLIRPQDDLLRPFALTAIRWHALNANPKESAIIAAGEVGPSLTSALSRGVRIQGFRAVSYLPTFLLRPVVGKLILDYSTRSTGHGTELAWLSTIGKAAWRIKEADAADLVREWIVERNRGQTNSEAKQAWRLAIRGAAQRIHEDDVASLVRDLVAEHTRRDTVNESSLTWIVPIAAAVSTLKSVHAVSLVREWVAEHMKSRNSPEEQTGWQAAIFGAAQSIHEDVAAAVVGDFIAQHNKPYTDPGIKKAWRSAISGAARRIRDGSAATLVRDLIAEHNKRDNDSQAKNEWRLAVSAAAGRIPETEAARLICEWIAEHNKPKNDSHARRAWQDAIEGAALRVQEKDAAHLIRDLIAKHIKRKTEIESNKARRVAILRAAHRVSDHDVARLIRDLVAEHNKPALDPELKSTCRDAIWLSAGRIHEDEAAELIRDLITEYNKRQLTPEAKEAWRIAVRSAAHRVSDHDVARLVRDLIAEHNRPRLDPVTKLAYRAAIRDSAQRVHEDQSASLVREWIAEHSKQTDPEVKVVWQFAIIEAAQRVHADDVTDLIRDLLVEHDKPDADRDAKEAWRKAIHRAASRADGKNVLSICNEMIERAWVDIAFDIASAGTDVAIVSQAAVSVDNGKVVPLQKPAAYVVKVREDLDLDKDLVAAPEAIRRLLGGPIRLSYKAEQLLKHLAEMKRRAEKHKDESVAILSETAWFEGAGITRQRINKSALVAELVQPRLVEERRDSPRLTRYRITPDGERYLAEQNR